MMTALRRLCLLFTAVLAACAGGPAPPDWKLNAQSAIERAQDAYLSGDGAIEAVEFARARAEIVRTGRVDLLARAELVRCATRVASLVLEPCQAFEALAPDAAPAEQAYASYLAGQVTAAQVPLLPRQHQALALAGANGAAVAALDDPLSRLVAAGVLMRRAQADPLTIATAIDTASSQGWRRPLLAWLGVQAQRAEQGGDREALARIRRRMTLIGGDPPR